MAPARGRSLPSPVARRATVIGAGSFGTALAVLLSRAGSAHHAADAQPRAGGAAGRADRENRAYLPGVALPAPAARRVGGRRAWRAPTSYSWRSPRAGWASPSRPCRPASLGRRTAIVSRRQGARSTRRTTPHDGAERAASAHNGWPASAGPAHAQEMVRSGAGLVVACGDEELARTLAQMFTRAGVVCEQSNDPLGVELAGAAKNAAALAAGATEAQGANAAGAAAGHIFAEVWRYAEGLGARPESMIGLAGIGDLVATALARESRNRRAGELLAEGVPAREIPARIGQAVEALEWVPLLARTLERGRSRGARDQRPRSAHLGGAAARRVGRAGAYHGPPAGPLASPARAGLLAAAVASALPRNLRGTARRRSASARACSQPPHRPRRRGPPRPRARSHARWPPPRIEGSRRTALATSQNVAHVRGAGEILARVPHREGLLARIARAPDGERPPPPPSRRRPGRDGSRARRVGPQVPASGAGRRRCRQAAGARDRARQAARRPPPRPPGRGTGVTLRGPHATARGTPTSPHSAPTACSAPRCARSAVRSSARRGASRR